MMKTTSTFVKGVPTPSEDRFCEFLTFSRGKIVLTKDVPYDAKSFKKIGCKKRLYSGLCLEVVAINYTAGANID